ncbi:hypothetical protein LVD17_24575 [Fulvivirga ulvae]|uniref:hypothetical protein n=1 Tax=Fulvivirga ulvae TaxID=2904245 RepID=UPI001F16CFA3|nr:hypothetical protein [Fulvivirga ulvae]UII31472.1 hypothetical protein LVD17_24575 [Fulvivirga ulvae]
MPYLVSEVMLMYYVCEQQLVLQGDIIYAAIIRSLWLGSNEIDIKPINFLQHSNYYKN